MDGYVAHTGQCVYQNGNEVSSGKRTQIYVEGVEECATACLGSVDSGSESTVGWAQSCIAFQFIEAPTSSWDYCYFIIGTTSDQSSDSEDACAARCTTLGCESYHFYDQPYTTCDMKFEYVTDGDATNWPSYVPQSAYDEVTCFIKSN